MNASDITIINIFDNITDTQNNCNTSLWGFSSIIQIPKHNILFDTGSNGRVLLQNMENNNIDISIIDTIFISHGHWDHIGGLDSVIELNRNVDIYLTKHLSKNFIRDYKKLSKSVSIIEQNITKIYDNIYSSGAIGDTLEQSIIIETNQGLIIIFGCAHSGVGSVTKMASEYFQKDILLVMGGFHLANTSDSYILNLINIFKECKTKYILPSHCTGERAKELFKKNMNGIYFEGKNGQIIKFNENGTLKDFS